MHAFPDKLHILAMGKKTYLIKIQHNYQKMLTQRYISTLCDFDSKNVKKNMHEGTKSNSI